MVNKTKWTIDPAHSEIGFKIKHLMISYVKGVFKKFDADILTSGDDFTTAEINMWIDPASINTGDEKRDQHLKSLEFFDINTYKEIRFSSGTIKKTKNPDSLELFGTLSIKNISKKVKFDLTYGGKIKDPWGNEKVGFTIAGKINRKDWELNWNTALEAGGIMVGEDVTINCEVQLIKVNKKEIEMKAEETKKEKVY